MIDLPKSMEQTLKSDLSGISIETAESFFDSLIDDPSLSSLPIVSFVKAIQSIPNILITRKIILFISCLQDTSLQKRVVFLEKINSCTKTIGNFYANLLNVLSKLDQEEKAKIVAWIFKMMLYEKIDIEMGNRLIIITANIQLSDLMALSEQKIDTILKNQTLLDSLVGSGVLTALYEMLPSDKPRPTVYEFNAIGKSLLYVMDEFKKDEEEKQ
jgi:hypothetical protein